MPTFVIGDIHGCLDQLLDLLKSSELIDDAGHWSAHDAHLWFLGDFTDRGPDGMGVIDLVMSLQREAMFEGGFVGALLGNHDVVLQEVYHFGNHQVPGFKRIGKNIGFIDMWMKNGGKMSDLERLSPERVSWLLNLPALAKVGDTLLMHADNTFYLRYGSSIESVNTNIHRILTEHDMDTVDRLEEDFAKRLEFVEPDLARLVNIKDVEAGFDRAQKILETFGGTKIVHGHTPIYRLLDRSPIEVTQAWEYQNGLCVNLDHCLYAGGEGFVYEIEESTGVWLEE
jgi:Calcineurin-like phosphoesterase